MITTEDARHGSDLGTLLRLLSLFQAQRYWSGTDLSERLEVTAKTLRRDCAGSAFLHSRNRCSFPGLAIHLMMLGIDFQVHEPPEFISHLRRLAEDSPTRAPHPSHKVCES